jgi:UDP-N-acetylglucosamine:LPS N-acetylglucosamine transferase
MDQSSRILILSASAGAGHLRAAQAIEQAACAKTTCDVRHVDALDHTTKMFRRLYQKAYIDLVDHVPQTLGLIYDHLDKPWKYERRRLAWDLKRRVERVAKESGAGNATIKVIGFTSEMHELMAAADLLVGKPGGLTTSEALARGLALVVVNPIPGQEERNADHLLEQGAAIRCNNLPVIAWKIDRLLDDPARLSAMQDRARRLGRPGAASEIADALLPARLTKPPHKWQDQSTE